MAKKYDDIVGWFYRNGKRIPIRSKKTTKERRDVTRAELETAKRKSGNPDLVQRVAYGMDPEVNHDVVYSKDGKYASGTYDESEKAERLGWKYEGTVSDLARKTGLFSDKPKNFVRKREPNRDMLRKNMWGPRNGKRKDRYALPQKKNFTGDPDEDYVKKVMKEYGVGRRDAIRLIRE